MKTGGRPTLRNVGLVMRDRVTLAADVHLPEGDGPWPCIVMLTPYSKDLFHGLVDAHFLDEFARHGYAAALVDFRGTSASEGIKSDAFEAVESADAFDAIEEVAAQDWCDGNVGIWGVSYCGVAALRAATAKPPHLRAVVAIEGSTDPYRYEVMRSGSSGIAMILGEWSAGMMLCLNSVPPTAGTPRGNDAQVWNEHLEALTPWHFTWRDHPTRDEYWQGREVDPSTIDLPTMVISGWRDTNILGAIRDFDRIPGPKRLIVGPWQHGLPDRDGNRPINTVREMLAWFERWIRPDGTADTPDPQVDLFVLGREEWESHVGWPVAAEARPFYLDGSEALRGNAPSRTDMVPVVFDATVGAQGGFGTSHLPQEQGADDARSTTFSSDPLAEPLEILGEPSVDVDLVGVTAGAHVAVRVLDVDEAGSSWLITKGFLRLANLEPEYVGQSVDQSRTSVRIACNPTRYRLGAGHRLRLSVAGADFPEMWPPSQPVDYAVVAGGRGPESSRLTIPVLTSDSVSASPLAPPDVALFRQPAGPSHSTLTVSRSDAGTVTVEASARTALETFDHELMEFRHSCRASTSPRSPGQTQVTTDSALVVHQQHRTVRIASTSYTSPDLASATVEIHIDDERVFERRFRHRPEERRDLDG